LLEGLNVDGELDIRAQPKFRGFGHAEICRLHRTGGRKAALDHLVRDPLKWMPVKRQITHQHNGDDRVMSVLIGSIKTDRDLGIPGKGRFGIAHNIKRRRLGDTIHGEIASHFAGLVACLLNRLDSNLHAALGHIVPVETTSPLTSFRMPMAFDQPA
jgi:hypothetical protein